MSDWFGVLPERWEQRKINELFTERREKVSDTDFSPLSVSKGGIVPQIATVAKSNAGDNRKKVCQGDFVINSRSDRRGSSGVSIHDGSVSLINIVLQPRKAENKRYFHYLLRNHFFIEEYYRNGRGIVADLWTTRYAEMKGITLPLPPREEQDQIVRYLDWKVSQINKLINAKKKQIAHLQEQKQAVINTAVTKGLDPGAEMKDSGVDWLGKIPADWTVERLGQHFSVNKAIAGKEGYPVFSITQQGLKVKDISVNEGQMATSYDKYQFVRPGNFAMNHMDLLTGFVGIAKELGVTSPDYRVFQLLNTETCSPDYYLLVFQLCYYRRIFYGFGRGAATKGRWRMPKTAFLNFFIPRPSIEEQVQIAEYVNVHCGKIDQAIVRFEQQISLFIEYRTRLISDVVTGKLDVRNISVPDYEAVEETAGIIVDETEEMEGEADADEYA